MEPVRGPKFPLRPPHLETILKIVNYNSTIAMFGPLGMQEMMLIFLIILLLFGAKKIPELARGIGKGMGEFKKAKEDFEKEIKTGEIEGKANWEKPSTPAASSTPASAPAQKAPESASETQD